MREAEERGGEEGVGRREGGEDGGRVEERRARWRGRERERGEAAEQAGEKERGGGRRDGQAKYERVDVAEVPKGGRGGDGGQQQRCERRRREERERQVGRRARGRLRGSGEPRGELTRGEVHHPGVAASWARGAAVQVRSEARRRAGSVSSRFRNGRWFAAAGARN